ncbi:maleate cis-trans isomerase family protein [Crenalkalicoccus roseus]|uniref:maleate cis-trans isomerase family protein n=1 Tax=Crenalkalicoccus roseus TaxID=1485588 RepID=UPI00195708E2|nr:aspartate/glutamate racemase family protein [Crenalkalicoccus roseus]
MSAFAETTAALPQPLVDLRSMPFTLDGGVAARAAIGLVVLATDHTIEHEWRALLGGLDGVGFFATRLWNDATITTETLRAMEGNIAEAVRLIRPGERIDAVAFGCTSGAMVIGDDVVAARVHEVRPGVPCCSPLSAATEGLRAAGCRRIALLTPYGDGLNRAMRADLMRRGLEVPVVGSFNHENDNEVARIDAASLRAAALELGRRPEADGLFVSCTSLRAAALVQELEAELGKPVTSSNHALAWRALRLAGVPDALPDRGCLFRLP